MTDILKQARQAMEGTTPGPWRQGEMLPHAVFAWNLPPDHKEAAVCDTSTPANARFIAAARTLVPAMADEIERLRKRVADLEAKNG